MRVMHVRRRTLFVSKRGRRGSPRFAPGDLMIIDDHHLCSESTQRSVQEAKIGSRYDETYDARPACGPEKCCDSWELR